MDPDAEVVLQRLKDLHAKEIEDHGINNLTHFEAFPKELNECSGYIRGLGPGPKPQKKPRNGGEYSQVRDEIQQLQQVRDESTFRSEVSDLQ